MEEEESGEEKREKRGKRSEHRAAALYIFTEFLRTRMVTPLLGDPVSTLDHSAIRCSLH